MGEAEGLGRVLPRGKDGAVQQGETLEVLAVLDSGLQPLGPQLLCMRHVLRAQLDAIGGDPVNGHVATVQTLHTNRG